MNHKQIKFCIGILFVLFYTTYAFDKDWHISRIFALDGIDQLSTLSDILPQEKIKRFNKLLPYLSKCFYSAENARNETKHIFNSYLRTVIRKYFVSFFIYKLFLLFIFLTILMDNFRKNTRIGFLAKVLLKKLKEFESL